MAAIAAHYLDVHGLCRRYPGTAQRLASRAAHYLDVHGLCRLELALRIEEVGAVRGTYSVMRKRILVVATAVSAVVGLGRPFIAQAEPSPKPMPGALASPNAIPQVPPPIVSPPAEVTSPEPARLAAPSSPASALAPVTLSSPQQREAPPAERPRPQQVHGRQLSEHVALGLSLGGTLASWGLFIGGAANKSGWAAVTGLFGTFLAPNMGHWYQGKIATLGTGLRAVAGLGVVVGFGAALLCGGHCEDDELDWAGPLFLGSGLLYIGATAYDIVDAPYRARNHNILIKEVRVAPVVTNRAAGFALGGRF